MKKDHINNIKEVIEKYENSNNTLQEKTNELNEKLLEKDVNYDKFKDLNFYILILLK